MNELNAKVAGILGWFKTKPRDHRTTPTWRRPGRTEGWSEPRFDADPALLPEMLAWIASRHDFASVNMTTWSERDRPGKPEWVWTATMHYQKGGRRLNITLTRYGLSLNEAVARLVVAVAEEKP